MTDSLIVRLNEEARIWPRSDIPYLLREAADRIAALEAGDAPKASEARPFIDMHHGGPIPAPQADPAPPVAGDVQSCSSYADHARIVAEKDAELAFDRQRNEAIGEMLVREQNWKADANKRAEAMAGLLREFRAFSGGLVRDRIDALLGLAGQEGAG